MTEQEWLESSDPTPMREYLRVNHKANERKLRLFALACRRWFMHLLSDERSRQAITFAYRFVEGDATHKERADVCKAACAAASDAWRERRTGAAIAAAEAAEKMTDSHWPLFAQRFEPTGWEWQYYAWQAANDSVFLIDTKDQCTLWRDLFSNPFRPLPTMNVAWLTWNAGTVPKLAQDIYEQQAFDRMPILADALEEAGCENPDILGHCRGPGPHVRGCWVLDLVLEKE